jgi:hypothetical protein
MAYDEKTAERVRKVLSGRREVVEKKLMGGLCFSPRRLPNRRGAQEVGGTRRRCRRLAPQPQVWGLQPGCGCDSLSAVSVIVSRGGRPMRRWKLITSLSLARR